MRRRDERGQATVEFALIIPVVIVMLLAVIQVALVAYFQLGVAHVAREAARAVAVDRTADVGQLVQSNATLGTNDVVIEVLFEPAPVIGREFVVVTVSYEVAPISRLFDPFATQMEVSSRVKMLMES